MTADELRKQYDAAGQSHVFKYFDQLSNESKEQLLSQLKTIEPKRIADIFKQATSSAAAAAPSQAAATGDKPLKLEGLDKEFFESVDNVSATKVKTWQKLGLNAIAENKVAVLLLAGGQGTRLGSSLPKGCYDIQLPSHKSLFQIQAERIKKLELLASKEGSKKVQLVWYVMTSGPTRKDTESFFKTNNFFGLNKDNVHFFEQGVLPALTKDGKIILEDKDKVSVAPDGNGGVYAALRESKVLEDMEKRGIEYIHAYCVDNCLVRVADPVFIGYCLEKKALCGAKVVRKVYAHEPVGVVCRVNGKFGVVEYSEIKKEDAERKGADGRLALDAANIANHFYKLSFLKQCSSREFEKKLSYHVANKKIKHIDLETDQLVQPSKPNGIKLELFIFDIFPFIEDAVTSKDETKTPFAVLSVPRDSEFSPLKNAPGAGVDNPETSRRDTFLQSLRFLKEAGAKVEFKEEAKEKMKVKEVTPEGEKEVEESVGCIEISPLLSYDGEGLDEYVRGKTVHVEKAVHVDSVDALKKLVR